MFVCFFPVLFSGIKSGQCLAALESLYYVSRSIRNLKNFVSERETNQKSFQEIIASSSVTLSDLVEHKVDKRRLLGNSTYGTEGTEREKLMLQL